MKRNIGIFNSNSRNRTRRRDEDLSPVNLSEREMLVIELDTIRIVIRSVHGYNAPAFLERMEVKLQAAKKALADYDRAREIESDAQESARIDRWLSDNWELIPEIPFGIGV